MRPHARPAKPRNLWIGLLGLLAMALVTAAFLWAATAIYLALA